MAGGGWRDFVPGEVLTAANVQDYLQDQSVMVFASAAARTSALASPTEGMISYLSDSNIVQMYTGSSWLTIADDGGLPVANGGTGSTTIAGAQDALQVGLVPVIPSSVAQSGGSASIGALGEVTFTTVTSFSLNGVFSTGYTNYVVKFQCTATNNAETRMKIRASGTDLSTSYYSTGIRTYQNGTSAITATNNAAYIPIADTLSGGGRTNSMSVFIANPAQALEKTFLSQAVGALSGVGIASWNTNSYIPSTASYDGITLYVSAGSITGVAQVFAYNN